MPAYAGSVGHPLERLAELDGVDDAVERAAAECARIPDPGARLGDARREAGARCATAGSALDGVRWPLDEVRRVAHGGEVRDDPESRVIRGASRVQAEVERLMPGTGGGGSQVPLAQLLARLHVAVSGSGSTGDDPDDGAAGRLRTGHPGDVRGLGAAPSAADAAARVALLADLVARPLPTQVSGIVLAAVVHAELLSIRPFPWGNGPVARAVFRWLLATRGVDLGVVVPEVRWVSAPNVYLSAVAGFATRDPARVAAWIRYCADSVVDGAGEAIEIVGVLASP